MGVSSEKLTIEQGETFVQVMRWQSKPLVYKAITAISKTAPVQITCPSHGLVDGWKAAISGVKGMVEINACDPPRSSEYHEITYVNANTVEINAVNTAAVDSNGDDLYSTYTSGGYLQYYTAVDLSEYDYDMIVLTGTGGTVLASSRAADDPLDIITATADNAAKTIAFTIDVADVNALTWSRGVYDVIATHKVSGVVIKLGEGQIIVSRD